jgi:hypothetical protein
MPSKKKSSSRQSRARKGVKKEEEVEKGAPEAKMERLKIDDNSHADEDAILEEAIKLAAAEKEALDAVVAKKEEQSKLLVKKKHCEACYHGFKTKITRIFPISPKHSLLCYLLEKKRSWDIALWPLKKPPKKNIPKCGKIPPS